MADEMAKIRIVIPAQVYTIPFYPEDHMYEGELNMDSIYDGYVHEMLQQINYDWDVVDE